MERNPPDVAANEILVRVGIERKNRRLLQQAVLRLLKIATAQGGVAFDISLVAQVDIRLIIPS